MDFVNSTSTGFVDRKHSAMTERAYGTNILTESQKNIFYVINYVFVCGVVSLFGTLANVINIIIFYRQGLNTTINISFFSLAISDLASLVLQQLFNVYANPLFVNLDLPIMYSELAFLTTALKREMFAKITCFITVFITAERCICIAFPLHVKQMITPTRTTIVIVCIYFVTAISVVPLFATLYIDWKFFPEKNRSLLALAFRKHTEAAEAAVYVLHASFGVLSFLAVVIFTLVLIYKLRQKNAWRLKANALQANSESISNKDSATIFMVVLIAGILIICYTPSVVLFLTTMFEPQFSVGGSYTNLYYSVWTFGLLTENINSSVNIFLYLKMSRKYRQTFRELFSSCLHNHLQRK